MLLEENRKRWREDLKQDKSRTPSPVRTRTTPVRSRTTLERVAARRAQKTEAPELFDGIEELVDDSEDRHHLHGWYQQPSLQESRSSKKESAAAEGRLDKRKARAPEPEEVNSKRKRRMQQFRQEQPFELTATSASDRTGGPTSPNGGGMPSAPQEVPGTGSEMGGKLVGSSTDVSGMCRGEVGSSLARGCPCPTSGLQMAGTTVPLDQPQQRVV